MKSTTGKRGIAVPLISAAAAWLLYRNRHRLPAPAADRHDCSAHTVSTPRATPPAAAPLPATRWKAYGELLLRAARAWSAHRAASKGAALALYTLFSLAPMLLLVVALAGLFFGREQVSLALLQQMQDLMGQQGAAAVRTLLSHSEQRSDGVLAGAISLVLLLIGATSAFAELKDSLDELWDQPPATGAGWWNLLRQRFLSFGLILVLVLMLLISLTVSTALAALAGLLDGWAASASFQLLSQGISSLLTFLIVSGLFAAIFKYLPEAPVAWRDVAVGSLLTALLFTLGKTLIGLYLGNGGVSTAYGAAASVVVLISWIYYSAQIFFYGALFTHEYARTLGSHAAETVTRQRSAQHDRVSSS